MMFFMVNSEDKHSESLVEKLSKAKPNEIMPLTQGEMDLYRSDDFQVLHLPEQGEHPFIKVEPGGSYIAIAGKDTNIDDLLGVQKHLNVKISIVRDYD